MELRRYRATMMIAIVPNERGIASTASREALERILPQFASQKSAFGVRSVILADALPESGNRGGNLGGGGCGRGINFQLEAFYSSHYYGFSDRHGR